MNLFADELLVGILHENTRQEVRLGQHLKAIADADDWPTLSRKSLDGRHNARAARKSPAAQVVAVAETTGKYKTVKAREFCRFVPYELDIDSKKPLDGVDTVCVAIGTWELDETDPRLA
jgi:hypothetical protein